MEFTTDRKTTSRMKRIRSRGSAIELHVARVLRKHKLRFREQASDLPGCPDFVVTSALCVVFVNGCYWHRHGTMCSRVTTPTRNRGLWCEKFEKTRARDARNSKILRANGWRVFTVWECNLTRSESIARQIRRVMEDL